MAKVFLHLAGVEKPPVSFLAGSNAVEWATSVVTQQQAQTEANPSWSVCTDDDG